MIVIFGWKGKLCPKAFELVVAMGPFLVFNEQNFQYHSSENVTSKVDGIKHPKRMSTGNKSRINEGQVSSYCSTVGIDHEYLSRDLCSESEA